MKKSILAVALATLFVGAASAQSFPSVTSWQSRVGVATGLTFSGNGSGTSTATGYSGVATEASTAPVTTYSVDSNNVVTGTTPARSGPAPVGLTIRGKGFKDANGNFITDAARTTFNVNVEGEGSKFTFGGGSCFNQVTWTVDCTLTFTNSTMRTTGVNNLAAGMSQLVNGQVQYISNVLVAGLVSSVNLYNGQRNNHGTFAVAAGTAGSAGAQVQDHYNALSAEVSGTRAAVASVRGLASGGNAGTFSFSNGGTLSFAVASSALTSGAAFDMGVRSYRFANEVTGERQLVAYTDAAATTELVGQTVSIVEALVAVPAGN